MVSPGLFHFHRPLVVGGTGFLGLNIAQALRERGLDVRITRRPSSITFIPRKLKLPMVEASLGDEESLYRAMAESDVVFCTAGHYPRYSVGGPAQVEHAVAGLRRVLSAARRARVRRLVFTSSVTTIGPAPPGRPADERDEWAEVPDSVYFAVKLAQEREVLRAVQEGLPGVVLCPSGCLGRYDLKAGTGFFIVALAQGTLPYAVDGPLNVVGVEDVAAAHVQAAERGEIGARYILAAHEVQTVDLLRMAARRVGAAVPERVIDMAVATRLNLEQEERCAAAGRGRPDIPVEFLDMLRLGHPYSYGRAAQLLGFTPAPLEEVVDRACAWFEKSGYLKRRDGKTPTETRR